MGNGVRRGSFYGQRDSIPSGLRGRPCWERWTSPSRAHLTSLQYTNRLESSHPSKPFSPFSCPHLIPIQRLQILRSSNLPSRSGRDQISIPVRKSSPFDHSSNFLQRSNPHSVRYLVFFKLNSVHSFSLLESNIATLSSEDGELFFLGRWKGR